MKKTYLLIILIACYFGANAQYYKHSSGIRTGYTSALTYKRFYTNEQALELMVSGRNDGLQVTGLYEFSKPLNLAFNDMFYVYYGVGAHVGYEMFSGRHFDPNTTPPEPAYFFDRQSYFTMGINTILGVEYRWLAIPLTIGLDVKPYFQSIAMRYGQTRFWDVGLSAKYVF